MTAWESQNVEGWSSMSWVSPKRAKRLQTPGKLELLELVQGGAPIYRWSDPWAPKKMAISLNFHWKEYVSSLEMAEHKMGFHWAPNIYRADLVGSIGSTAQEMDRIKQTYSQERDAKKGCGYTLEFRSGTRWWFHTFFIFTPTWGRFPFWLFFRWVETTDQGIWHKMYRMARLWFQRFCIFTPNSLGKWYEIIQFGEHIFHMGWTINSMVFWTKIPIFIAHVLRVG